MKLKAFWCKKEFFELGINLMTDSLSLHLGWWEFTLYTARW